MDHNTPPRPIYLYADETGNLDYGGSPNPQGGSASTYFGVGTATFITEDHGEDLLNGLHLRARRPPKTEFTSPKVFMLAKTVIKPEVRCLPKYSGSPQVADYALWAVRRNLEGKKCTWYAPCIKPNLTSTFFPWGQP